jgi:hypothetical protein
MRIDSVGIFSARGGIGRRPTVGAEGCEIHLLWRDPHSQHVGVCETEADTRKACCSRGGAMCESA